MNLKYDVGTFQDDSRRSKTKHRGLVEFLAYMCPVYNGEHRPNSPAGGVQRHDQRVECNPRCDSGL